MTKVDILVDDYITGITLKSPSKLIKGATMRILGVPRIKN